MEKEKEFETVWDHGITKEETIILFGFDTTKEKYIAMGEDETTLRKMLTKLGFTKEQADEDLSIHTLERNCNEDIYNLYTIRGNKEMAQKYLDRIPDDIDKIFSLMNHDCVRNY